jgi:predicted enzyme involved in methoxymalonyl-ACP biosynthesis
MRGRQATYGPLWAGVTGDEGVNRLQVPEVATNKTHEDVRGLFAQFIR